MCEAFLNDPVYQTDNEHSFFNIIDIAYSTLKEHT